MSVVTLLKQVDLLIMFAAAFHTFLGAVYQDPCSVETSWSNTIDPTLSLMAFLLVLWL
jgi:hypothetical protein